MSDRVKFRELGEARLKIATQAKSREDFSQGVYAAFRDPAGNVLEKNLSTASLQSMMLWGERFTGVRLIQEHERFYALRMPCLPDFTSTGLALLI